MEKRPTIFIARFHHLFTEAERLSATQTVELDDLAGESGLGEPEEDAGTQR
ncbi:hypothetical protein [Demetria terragena]|uniref:hypothetical protein n=1 Tax=Demetria terragena TaxID=63959 RepID=UPI00036E34A2|nr:hypothetical protein [Demetria terragena]